VKNYIPYFDSSFVGLTGTEERLFETAKAYGAFYEIVGSAGENSDAYSVNHSALTTYLVSPDGKWKLIYNFDQLGDAEKDCR
jgi:cytochrome oxidase Cu insertion factor (SCO1/SenC/PrrC family)